MQTLNRRIEMDNHVLIPHPNHALNLATLSLCIHSHPERNCRCDRDIAFLASHPFAFGTLTFHDLNAGILQRVGLSRNERSLYDFISLLIPQDLSPRLPSVSLPR
jgi:hypothetical protein